MKIRTQKEQLIRYTQHGDPYVFWGKTQVLLSAFYRELVRFVDDKREYWHGMDCTRDLVIHINRDNDHAVVGKVSE